MSDKKINELLKLTANQVREGKYNKAILALGSCEAHGEHLAEGTDTLVSYMLSCKVAEEVENLLVLPPVTVGYSRHYERFPFTLSLSYNTLISVIYDILESTVKNGIDRIFIMNGHDGNIAPIEVASRSLKEKYPNVKIATLAAWWVTAGEILPRGTFEVMDGQGHAGEGESSIAYYLYPQWCEPELAEAVVPDNLPEHIEIKWDFSEITDKGLTGDATKATPEKGEKIAKALTELVVKTLRDLDEKNWSYNTTNMNWKSQGERRSKEDVN
ncbi:creatininase family protein [Anaerosphaera multitolerans]|uniref:Creatininase family protein n=1 Tax=Anaerosphaera multitolerans TaxID=2487351 RepID=A0A437S8W3_9FIRM|nr:creatininase family protein [Anaerosphaera multitolerans]RVU55549.1 creatininase family protein [Anaerosphaera multitolerans]